MTKPTHSTPQDQRTTHGEDPNVGQPNVGQPGSSDPRRDEPLSGPSLPPLARAALRDAANSANPAPFALERVRARLASRGIPATLRHTLHSRRAFALSATALAVSLMGVSALVAALMRDGADPVLASPPVAASASTGFNTRQATQLLVNPANPNTDPASARNILVDVSVLAPPVDVAQLPVSATATLPRIVTGPTGSALARLSGHGKLLIEQASQLRVVEALNDSVLLDLESGAVAVQADHRDDRRAFRVKTGAVDVLVVGTVFRVARDPAKTVTVSTHEGKVKVVRGSRVDYVSAGETLIYRDNDRTPSRVSVTPVIAHATLRTLGVAFDDAAPDATHGATLYGANTTPTQNTGAPRTPKTPSTRTSSALGRVTDPAEAALFRTAINTHDNQRDLARARALYDEHRRLYPKSALREEVEYHLLEITAETRTTATHGDPSTRVSADAFDADLAHFVAAYPASHRLARVLIMRAHLARDTRHDYPAAVALYDAALARLSSRERNLREAALLYRAYSLHEMGSFDAAIAGYRQLLDIDNASAFADAARDALAAIGDR